MERGRQMPRLAAQLYHGYYTKVKSFMARSSPEQNLLPLFVGSFIKGLTVMLLKYPNGQLLVAVDHNQRLRMASETVDPIDWPLPPPPPSVYRAQPLERYLHSLNRFSLCQESNSQPSAYEATTLPLRPHGANTNLY